MVNAAKKAGNIVQLVFSVVIAMHSENKRALENGKIGKVHQVIAQIHYNTGSSG